MTIKVLYYVDSDDNTKGNLMAFPSEKDLRNTETIEQIGQALHEANFGDLKLGFPKDMTIGELNEFLGMVKKELAEYATTLYWDKKKVKVIKLN